MDKPIKGNRETKHKKGNGESRKRLTKTKGRIGK